MGDFGHVRRIGTTRRPRRCEQCEKPIEVGSAAVRHTSRWEGMFLCDYTHGDCWEAAVEYAHKHGLYGEEWPWFHDMDWERADIRWLKTKYPAVHARLGLADWEEPTDD